MAKRQSKKRPGPPASKRAGTASTETMASVAATVAWTVSVTMVVACDIAAIAAHLYLLNSPGSRPVAVLAQLMLFGGAVIGVASLALLPVVYRVRRTPPPTGFTVFACCAASAPLLAIVARAMQQ